MTDTIAVIKWLNNLKPNLRKTWNCSYCKQRNLQEARNCKGQYADLDLMLVPDITIQQCPISLIDSFSVNIYKLVKRIFSENSIGYYEYLSLPASIVKIDELIGEIETLFEKKNT